MCAHPKIRRNCHETRNSRRMPDQSNRPVRRLDKEYGRCRAVTAATARSSRAGPGEQDLPLADLTCCFVQGDRNAVYSRPRPHCGGLGRRSVMTILQKPPQSGNRTYRKRCYRSAMPVVLCATRGRGRTKTLRKNKRDGKRSDPAYARICEEVRQTREKGEEASRRAEEAKATWDARVAAQRQANDDAEKAHHGSKSKADQTPGNAKRRAHRRPRRRSVPPREQRTIQPRHTRSPARGARRLMARGEESLEGAPRL